MRLASVASNSQGELVGRFEFDNAWQAAHLLTTLAEEDGTRVDFGPEVFAWAHAIVTACRASSPASTLAECIAQSIHGSVQGSIAFRHEAGERFQSARTTMLNKVGDCDCHARLVYALARAAGLPAQLAYFDDRRRRRVIRPGDPVPPDDGTQPVHVTALLPMRAGSGYAWAETTIPARFGEDPYAAYRRLKSAGALPERGELAS